MLNDRRIKDMGLIVSGFEEKSLRGAGYDLRISKLVWKKRRKKAEEVESSNDEFGLDPQGVVVAISQEILHLPDTVCAYASVKTSLSRKGILAINAGVIDPGWEGPISSLLLNFGTERFDLRNGDVFLRLTFHEIPTPEKRPPGPKTRDEYERDVEQMFARRLGGSFMNLDAAAEKAAVRLHKDMRAILWGYLPLAALLLAGLTFLVNFGTLKLANWTTPSEMVLVRAKALTDDVERRDDKLQGENQQLQEEIKQLQGQLDQMKNRK